jgi:hypothetical protein
MNKQETVELLKEFYNDRSADLVDLAENYARRLLGIKLDLAIGETCDGEVLGMPGVTIRAEPPYIHNPDEGEWENPCELCMFADDPLCCGTNIECSYPERIYTGSRNE